MNRLDVCFRELRTSGKKALIAFTMAGDPTLAATARALRLFDAAGVDIIELGIPFSDPLADGPTIQAAAQRALASGTTVRRVLALIARFRRMSDRPIVLLSYLNPLVAFGGVVPARTSVGEACAPLLREAHRAGLDGLVVPDLPVEESYDVRRHAQRQGIAWIPLAAPTSSAERLRRIARAAHGFIYYVSVTGTTGARRQLPPDVTRGVQRLRRLTRLPVCVGFGIATPAEARRIARHADGVIVGSAIVQRWAGTQSTQMVGRFIRALGHAIHEVKGKPWGQIPSRQ